MQKYILIAISIFSLIGCSHKETINPQQSIQRNTTGEDFVEVNKTVKINSQIINVEIADTPELQYQGLSFRKELCKDCGMLFKFNEKDKRTFVMRNMNFPLDIIFINENKVFKIERNLKPEGDSPKNLYSSGEPANYVLEVNGGYADKFGIKEGDEIIY